MENKTTVKRETASVSSLAPERQERIWKLTKEKIEQSQQVSHCRRRPAHALSALVAAVIVLAAMSLTAFAAYENNWFGLRQIFGQQAALVEPDVMHYGTEQPKEAETMQAEPEKPAATNAAPVQNANAPVAEAEVGDWKFALQEMLVGHDTAMAIIRIDAKTEDAAKVLPICGTEAYPGEQGGFYLVAERAAAGKQKETTNGSMGMKLLTVDGKTAYFLLTNTGGSFALGDRIMIHMLDGARGKDLFDVTVERLIESERTLTLDAAAYEDKPYRWESLRVTPVGLTIYGSYDPPNCNMEQPSITIERKDGARFALQGPENNYQNQPFGTYGSMTTSFAGGLPENPTLEYSWIFSQVVDLEELAAITVDGVVYSMP